MGMAELGVGALVALLGVLMFSRRRGEGVEAGGAAVVRREAARLGRQVPDGGLVGLESTAPCLFPSFHRRTAESRRANRFGRVRFRCAGDRLRQFQHERNERLAHAHMFVEHTCGFVERPYVQLERFASAFACSLNAIVE